MKIIFIKDEPGKLKTGKMGQTDSDGFQELNKYFGYDLTNDKIKLSLKRLFYFKVKNFGT